MFFCFISKLEFYVISLSTCQSVKLLFKFVLVPFLEAFLPYLEDKLNEKPITALSSFSTYVVFGALKGKFLKMKN